MKQQEIFLAAAAPEIKYFGNWREEGARRFTRSRFSACYFNFRGPAAAFHAVTGPDKGIVHIFLDGNQAASVDCYAPGPAAPKEVYRIDGLEGDRVHNLVVQASRDRNPAASDCVLEIAGFSAGEPLDYIAELRRQMLAEYDEILGSRKKWLPPENWKRVPYRAVSPERGVSLGDGVFRDIFEINVKIVKRCFTLEDYCEGDGAEFLKTPEWGLDHVGHGWSSWLPASIEAKLLAGAAHALRWGEDPELRRIMDKIVADIKARMRDDGYYNYYPEDKSFNVRHVNEDTFKPNAGPTAAFGERKNYDRVFWTRAMIAAHAVGNPDALPLARRMYDWFNGGKNFLPFILFGGNATNGMPGGPLMYHTPLGKNEDIITSERFFDQDYWMDAFIEQQP
ncbi:MAG: glycoside hydrolase family 127 protein, partial [Treponema sp.]|nr:glycoside hydrolase family 127 protein [Treponema sp.]